jgi:hypothetical protein
LADGPVGAFRAKPLLIAGSLTSGLGYAGFAFVDRPWQAFICSAVGGAGLGVTNTANRVLSLALVTAEQRASLFALGAGLSITDNAPSGRTGAGPAGSGLPKTAWDAGLNNCYFHPNTPAQGRRRGDRPSYSRHGAPTRYDQDLQDLQDLRELGVGEPLES